MTTKELTERLVDDLCSEIPIEFDGDEQGVREEMNAIIYCHVVDFRQHFFEKAIEALDGKLRKLYNQWKLSKFECEDILADVRSAMLNENKE